MCSAELRLLRGLCSHQVELGRTQPAAPCTLGKVTELLLHLLTRLRLQTAPGQRCWWELMSESLCRCVRAPWCPQRAGGFVCQQRSYPILAYLRGIKNPPAVGSRFKGGFPKTRCKSRPGGTYQRSTGEPAWDRVLGGRKWKGLLMLHRFVLMRGFSSVIRMWGLCVGCWEG